ncbi:kanadaptin isoform X1 [Bactrocera dorsalis]|uniref:Kanadaptin isoform X1 n=1 Tax=Bactrocera dorsalis TaxID=27457 RepID=A0A6I9UPX6_BACDO|nr:kanadaptin isoform X1 [Bactrocera dorsalis]
MDEFKVPLMPPNTAGKVEKPPEAQTSDVKDVSNDKVKEIPKAASGNAPNQVCPYKVPPWSEPPPETTNYKFEVLKSGQIISEIDNLQKQAVWKFGRLPPPANDLELAHPTISRFHAILQYRPKKQHLPSDAEKDSTNADPPEGWYIYDLKSTHGTFLNKQRIPPQVFIRMRVGHMLRLGASTRSYILQGPEEDAEPESDLTVTELREQQKQKQAAAEADAIRKKAETEEQERNEGINWGMGEDADEETDLSHNPFASTNNEELFLDDPKKTLRGYFEREGLQLEYKCDEMSVGSFVCRVELPLDDAYGRPIIAEVVHKGRKKECVVQCALEACRILDRHGVLRQSNQEPLKRKVKSTEDFDEDDFLDRTGDIERKKLRKSNPTTNVALTYEDLLRKDSELVVELQRVADDIVRYQETQRRLKASQSNNSDDLDHFMENLTDDASNLDKTEIRKLRLEQQRLNVEKQKVQRLIKLAKPIDFHLNKPSEKPTADSSTKRQLPMIGKRNQFSKFKIAKMVTTNKSEKANHTNLASDEEEVEEDNEISLPKNNDVDKPSSIKTAASEEGEEIKPVVGETEISEASQSSECTKKLYGPAVIPITKGDREDDVPADMPAKPVDTKSPSTECTHTDDGTEAENTRKKRRQRQRQRQKRQEIDMEDLEEHESNEKYAKWVPPANQSGDGYTELNDKYGY